MSLRRRTDVVVPAGFICSPLTNQQIRFAQQNYSYLKNLTLAENVINGGELPVDILSGLDYYYSFLSGKTVRGPPNGPVALESIFGWILCGPVSKGYKNLRDVNTNLTSTLTMKIDSERICNEDQELREQLEKFWEVDSLGLSDEGTVYDQFKNDIYFDGERYTTKLPFKKHHEYLPDNYQLSKNRLVSLKRRLDKNCELKEEYNNIIQGYKREGIVEEVDTLGCPGKVHYLPHQPVVRNEKETTKVRIVFDGSAKSDGASINQCLYSGPCLLTLIFDILLRFRMFRIGLISDIQQAFLNVAISEDDRDVLRFLWFDDIFSNNPKVIILRFLRVVFGIICSPFLLNGTIHYHLSKYSSIDNEFVNRFLRDLLYVDDSTTSVSSVSEGFEFYTKSKLCLKDAGFNLRKWCSNSKELIQLISDREKASEEECDIHENMQQDKESYAKRFLGCNESEIFKKVLGIVWDIEKDEFVFHFQELIDEAFMLPATKRNLLRISAKLYDPLGLMCPIVIQSKLLFQRLCIDKLHWDDTLPNEISKVWFNWLNDLRRISSFSLSRYVFTEVTEKVINVELHGFCDSSKRAYSATCYVRAETSIGVITKLVAAKAKVAPIQALSIPRLELLSRVLLTKLSGAVKRGLSCVLTISKCYYWSDSEIVLFWILGITKEWKLWVENRVNFIRDNTDINNWNHVPGNLNPADIPTRECLPSDVINNYNWWNGPEFLLSQKECWPKKLINDTENAVILAEMKGVKNVNTNIVGIDSYGKKKNNQDFNLDKLIRCDNFSSHKRLLLVTAYIKRFINNLKACIKKDGFVFKNGFITSSELRIRITQKIEIVCNLFLISCWKALLAQNIYLKFKI